MILSDPRTPQEFATAIGRALDQQDQLIANFLIKKFSITYPNEYNAFLPVMQAEVMRRKQQ